MQSQASTVAAYLKSLPPERRAVIQAVRKAILAALPKGYKETMHYGMIGYVVPLTKYPEGYLNDKKIPLGYAALAAQKNYYAVYLSNVYNDAKILAEFTRAYKASGKKLDMGKSCVRFKKLDDLPLEVISAAIARTSMKDCIAAYEAGRRKK